MGFSTDLASAAKKLRQNIDDGIEVKAAVRMFAEDVEKAAEIAKESARRIIERSVPSDG
jgi:hypothetical protein